jgi:2-polyprenyl-3-methyl-5-hydroxy-6-metoxy-1,4-benzoquinol methylase
MGDMKEYYEKYWDRDTDVSDNDVTTPERKQRLLQTLARHIKPGGRVLDLGCGGGQFAALLKKSGYDAMGMDLSASAIEMAQRNHPGVEYNVLNPDCTIPVENSVFDAVWSTEVIEHVLDVHGFLSEINRVLKPNGLLVLTTPYHGGLKNLLISLMKFDRHFDPEGSHIRFFDRKGLERCLRKAGFAPSSFGGIGRFWMMWRTWWVVAEKIS